MNTTEHATIDLDRVVDSLRLADTFAYIEQTGGGCATIFAGPQRPCGDDGCSTHYTVMAGPGWFDGPEWTEGRAYVSDFFIGPDDHGDDNIATLSTPESIGAVWEGSGCDPTGDVERKIAQEILAKIADAGFTEPVNVV